MEKDYATIDLRNSELSIPRFLSADEEAKYKELVDKKYSSEKVKGILNMSSNVFKVIELQNQGINVASLSDLGLIAEQYSDRFFKSCMDVPVVVLRDARDSCRSIDFLARDLANQIKTRNLKNSLVVTDLSIEESAESIYGLKFKTTDKTKFYEAPELDYSNNKRKFSRTNKRGIPIFEKNGHRNFYAGREGLVRLHINKERDLDSTYTNLAYPFLDCKVFVVDRN